MSSTARRRGWLLRSLTVTCEPLCPFPVLSAVMECVDRPRGGSSPPPPPPTYDRQPSVVPPPPPRLPGSSDDSCSSDGESPPPPPSSDFPDFMLPPPPPPPATGGEDGEIDDFEAAIRASGAAGTSVKTQQAQQLDSPPPPPSTFLEDDTDDDDDDSDVEPSRDNSTLDSSSITPDDVVSPLGLAGRPLPPARSNSKLSFTAPTTSSPLSSGPQPTATVNSTSKFEVVPAAPPAPLNSTAPPSESISLSTLSSQLSLHMEIQTFAANRRASLIAGASPASLIPGTAASPVAVAASSTPANAAVSSGGAVRSRPTHGIRSMSMSMQQSPFSSLPFPSASIGISGGVGAAGASNPFATPKKRRRRASRPVAASKRSDAEVLDLFGDGPQTPIPDLRSSLLAVAASSPTRSSRLKQPASASALLASINEAADDDGDIPPPPPPPLPEHGAVGGGIMHVIEEEEDSNGRMIMPVGGLAQPGSLSRAGSQRNSVDVSAQALHSILTTSNATSLGSRKSSMVNPTYNPPAAVPVGPSSLALPPEEDIAPEAIAMQNESDDLTASFHPPPTHIAAHFPYRKVLRTPLRTTACLQLPPLETVSEAQIDSQMRMLSLLSEALRSSRSEFRTMCVTNLRAENEALRQRVNELRHASGSGGAGAAGLAAGSRGPPAGRSIAGLGGMALEQQQRETLRRSMRALAPHARWNQALHAVHDKLTLELDEMRRRCQFQLPAASSMSFGGADDYLNHTAPPASDPAVPAASARNTPQQQPRSLLISPADMKPPARGNQTPYGSARGDLLSPSSPGAVPGEFPGGAAGGGGGGLHAQLQRFPITKINMIRKNTPRIFELDLTTKTLTICKNVKSGSSSKDKDAAAGSKDDDFANRDIVISASTLVSAELHPKQELQFELSFHVTQAPSASGMMAPQAGSAGGSKDKADKKGDSKEKSSTLKNWKILFASRDERERFYRLLQVTLLSSETPTPASTPAASSSSSAAPRPHAMGGAAAGSRGAFDGSSSDTLSTSYPQPGGGPHATLTYTPRPAQLTPAILQQVRVLPLLPLASSLHTIYCLTKKNAGWKYGLKLVSWRGASGLALAASPLCWSETHLVVFCFCCFLCAHRRKCLLTASCARLIHCSSPSTPCQPSVATTTSRL